MLWKHHSHASIVSTVFLSSSKLLLLNYPKVYSCCSCVNSLCQLSVFIEFINVPLFSQPFCLPIMASSTENVP